MTLLKDKNFWTDCAVMAVLALLFALNYYFFIVCNQFAPAGFNGIGAMLEYKFGFNIGYFTFIINVPLCIFAYFFIDHRFAVKTFIFCAVYAVATIAFQDVDLSSWQYDAQGVDTVYPALISGAVGGFVYGVTFRRNSSTGGADVVAKYVSIKNPLLNFFWINFAINAVVAIISMFVYAKTGPDGNFMIDYKPVSLCMLYCFLNSLVGNMIIRGSKSAYKFVVITSHAEEINREIIEKLNHSSTHMKAYGAFSEQEKDVIVCVLNKRQIMEFKKILKKYDDTFAFVETVNEIIGNFNKIEKKSIFKRS